MLHVKLTNIYIVYDFFIGFYFSNSRTISPGGCFLRDATYQTLGFVRFVFESGDLQLRANNVSRGSEEDNTHRANPSVAPVGFRIVRAYPLTRVGSENCQLFNEDSESADAQVRPLSGREGRTQRKVDSTVEGGTIWQTVT